MTLSEIRALKVGETREFADTFSLKRVTRNAFMLADSRVTERARWGTATEIAADVTHTLEYGCLPIPSGERW